MRILIVDDHPIVREGLKCILRSIPGLEVAGEAGDARSALQLVCREPCDVVLLDISLPGGGGLDLLARIREHLPDLPVLVISVHSEDLYAVRALRIGASGYLTKTCAPGDLVRAVERVAAGGRFVTPEVAEALAAHLDVTGSKPRHENLSERELQVLRMLAGGMSPTQIAEDLSLSIKTVSTYRTRVLRKMRLRNNVELTRYALEHALVE